MASNIELQMHQVVYRKGPGTITLTDTQVMYSGRKNFNITIASITNHLRAADDSAQKGFYLRIQAMLPSGDEKKFTLIFPTFDDRQRWFNTLEGARGRLKNGSHPQNGVSHHPPSVASSQPKPNGSHPRPHPSHTHAPPPPPPQQNGRHPPPQPHPHAHPHPQAHSRQPAARTPSSLSAHLIQRQLNAVKKEPPGSGAHPASSPSRAAMAPSHHSAPTLGSHVPQNHAQQHFQPSHSHTPVPVPHRAAGHVEPTIRSAQQNHDAELAKQRKAALAADDQLKQTYDNFVTAGIISEAEFWESHHLETSEKDSQMRVGLANSVLGDGAQSTFGSTVHYEITPQDIHNIFVEQPNVHRAYKQNVPLKMSEEEFWTRYFRSKYYHTRRKAHNQQEKYNRKAELARQPKPKRKRGEVAPTEEEEQESKDTAMEAERDHYVDTEDTLGLANADESVSATEMEKLPVRPDVDIMGQDMLDAGTTEEDKPNPHASLDTQHKARVISRLNRHSQLLVDGGGGADVRTLETTSERAEALLRKAGSAVDAKRAKQLTKVVPQIDDNDMVDDSEVPDSEYRELKIRDYGAYFEGPNGASSSSSSSSQAAPRVHSGISNQHANEFMRHACMTWLDRSTSPAGAFSFVDIAPSSELCLDTLKDITHRSWTREKTSITQERLKKKGASGDPDDLSSRTVYGSEEKHDVAMPAHFANGLVNHYFKPVCELVRHFWALFPCPPKDKPELIWHKLDEYRTNLNQYCDMLKQSGKPEFVSVLEPILHSIDAVSERLRKYKETGK